MDKPRQALLELKEKLEASGRGRRIHEMIDAALASDDPDEMRRVLDRFDMMETTIIQLMRTDDGAKPNRVSSEDAPAEDEDAETE